jgi:hypothetical protein
MGWQERFVERHGAAAQLEETPSLDRGKTEPRRARLEPLRVGVGPEQMHGARRTAIRLEAFEHATAVLYGR